MARGPTSATNCFTNWDGAYGSWPNFGNELLYELGRRGVKPIIAHPERYVDVQKDIAKIETAVRQGALLQITAGSILGQTTKEMQSCCLRLLDAGWVHVVASDAHNNGHAWPGEAIKAVEKRVGSARARQIFEDNPRAILEGQTLASQMVPEKSRSGLGRLFGARR